MGILRKTLPFLALLTLATSCSDEYVTEEYINVDQYTGSQVRNFGFDVKPSDWKVEHADDGRNYLYAEFEMKELNAGIIEDGAVIGSVLYTYNITQDLHSWNNLPYVFPFITKEDSVVSENIRFEYEVGKVTFVIEDQDAVEPEEMVNPIKFKVTLISNIDTKTKRTEN